MSNSMQGMEHESSIDAEIMYTSYKWYFKHWSLLYHLYEKGVTSPGFDVTGFQGCACVLTLKPNVNGKSAFLEVDISGNIIFCSLKITVSFVDQDMKRLMHFQSVYPNSWFNPASLSFCQPLTAQAVSKFLRNDTLILFFELKIVKTVKYSPISTNILVTNFEKITRDKIDDLYANAYLRDVIINFKNTEKPRFAHRLILAANSPVFLAMFTNKMKETAEFAVEIEDIEVTVFDVFLRFMYTGKVDNIGDVVKDLIGVADKYRVMNLLHLCENYMATHLNEENVYDYLRIGLKHSRSILENAACEYIKSNTHILARIGEHNLFAEHPTLMKRIFSK